MRTWLSIFSFIPLLSFAQDSLVDVNRKVVTLKQVVVRSNLNVPAFVQRVKDDTTFYKAFRNLRVLGYTALNDIRMFDKKGRVKASLFSRTIQKVRDGCRWMNVVEQNVTGDMLDRNGNLDYYTAEMYAGLFFASDTICGETNIVTGIEFTTKGKKGLAKHKEQLKMLFFNPGKRIPGIPFIGRKVALFDEDVSELYDFEIDMDVFKGQACYVFKMKPRKDLTSAERNKIVINDMVTWFNINNWEIVARNYDLSYRAGVYDFDVHIEVEMTKHGNLLVPRVMRYNGTWDVVTKKRETAVFTATLFDFNAG